ncbi:AraC family transcriptional regulator [Roseivirga sp. E12]|uniref:helix-turn-helix domain-containing protein n=1 Tax=Roseivirga sp. E12 TaxID=2819237 RepID=UPI001ABC5BED|nr:AraC family transcriptional regulator [Roseivirga sp. E12]MBO3696893.1 helix-turn-helix transcriptional regulator [Roseivirga sp. E12]
MTFYERKLKRLNEVLYKNQSQIDAIIDVKNYIDCNYETDLNLDLLSKVRFISKYHLIRLFKKYYGLTPRQHLIDKRIQKSKEHLTKGITVTEACFFVGFSSLSSFSALFKTKTGKTPSQFRKEQLSRNDLVYDS